MKDRPWEKPENAAKMQIRRAKEAERQASGGPGNEIEKGQVRKNERKNLVKRKDQDEEINKCK